MNEVKLVNADRLLEILISDLKQNFEQKTEVEATIEMLAELDRLNYDRLRRKKASELGIRTTTLDELVDGKRNEKKNHQIGTEVTFKELEPWPAPVNGQQLLDE